MRRRVPVGRPPRGGALVPHGGGGETSVLRHVVAVRFGADAARTYIRRALGLEVRLRLVALARGERPGVVRCVEVQHALGGERSWVVGTRRLADGSPAGPLVPDQRVTVATDVVGPLARTGALGRQDVLVLHVPTRPISRFLPAVFRGDGPVSVGDRPADTPWLEGDTNTPAAASDAPPLERFLFVFQHLFEGVSDEIAALHTITDPWSCDPRLLSWLASWVAFDLDPSLPVQRQRELVAQALRLHRTRGTKRGIEEMVRVLVDAPVKVVERKLPRPMALGAGHLAAAGHVAERHARGHQGACYLSDHQGARPTSFFEIVLEHREAFDARFGERAAEVLHRIVDVVSRERPAHVSFTVRFDTPA